MVKDTRYTTIKLTRDLAATIDHHITLNPLGFGNRTEFIRYCIRRFIENENTEDGTEDTKK